MARKTIKGIASFESGRGNTLEIEFPDFSDSSKGRIFTYDVESGIIKFKSNSNKEKDTLIDNKNKKIISDDIVRGILRNNSNFKKNGFGSFYWKESIRLFVDISMYTYEEIVMVVYKENVDKRSTNYIEVRKYNNNKLEWKDGKVITMDAGTSQEIKPTFTSKDKSFKGIPRFSIHTHPGHPKGVDYIGRPDPSIGDAHIGLKNKNIHNVKIPFYIIGSKNSLDELYKYEPTNRIQYKYSTTFSRFDNKVHEYMEIKAMKPYKIKKYE